MSEVPNLVFGMHHLNITQLPGGALSHPNLAVDLAGEDTGIDFWFAKACALKCIAGEFGYGTYFFIPCDSKGNHIPVMCADGKQRKVTIALTHSNKQYVKTTVGKIYAKNQPCYEEGGKGAKGAHTFGNHIHLEVAEGYKTTKYKDTKLGVLTMGNELNPLKVMFVLDGYTKVVNSKGATLVHTKSETTKIADKYAPSLPFTQPNTNAIVNAHRYDFNYANFQAYIKKAGGYAAYVRSLGGVFTKWSGRNITLVPDYQAKTIREFQEACDYVFGLMTMYGFNYNKGKPGTNKNWGKGADDAFYPSSADYDKLGLLVYENGHKTTIDLICAGTTRGGMTTNCGWSVTYCLRKAGLIPADAENVEVEFYGNASYHKYYRNRGAVILTPKNTSDLRVGDVLGFFGSGSGFTYKHCAICVAVDKAKGTYTLYDGGSARFIKTRGNNIVGKLGDSPLYGSYTSWKVLRLKEISNLLDLKYDKAKAGAYQVTSDNFKMRSGAGTDKKQLCSLAKGTLFTTDGDYLTDKEGRVWLYGTAKSGKVSYRGFCCAKSYLKKV